jgi:hypothetical protein
MAEGLECNAKYKRSFPSPPYKNKGIAVWGHNGRYKKKTKDEMSLKLFGSGPTPPIHSQSWNGVLPAKSGTSKPESARRGSGVK